MARRIAAAIDIGTSQVKAVIAEELFEEGRPSHRVIGRGSSECRGTKEGYIVNPAEVSASVAAAVRAAEKAAGTPVKRAFVSVGGIGLSGLTISGQILISRADLEVSERDVEECLRVAEAAIPPALSLNRKIINTIPVEYKVDGKPVWGRVEGLKAQKLEVKALFVTCLEHHIEDLIRAVEDAGVEVVDVAAAPIAASFVTLSKKQKKAGCVLVNIGAETLSMVVYENGTPVSLEVFAMGSESITKDIALGFKLSLEEAESIKQGAMTRATVSKKKLDDIIGSRAREMFELVEDHLKNIKRDALLPAGAILTGGGSNLAVLKHYAEDVLKLPASFAEIHYGDSKQKDAAWATAYGLTVVAFNADNEQSGLGHKPLDLIRSSGKKSLRTLSDWFSKFLP